MPIQPATFNTRVREHSDLSPQALLVALTIAELRFKRRLKPLEPLPLTLADVARHCHMSRSGCHRYLDECIRSGWIVGRNVHRDGQQQANEYFLCDPTDPEAESRRLDSVIASEGQKLSPGVGHKVRRRLDTVRRSSYNGDADDAAPRGGGGSDEQGDQTQGINTAAVLMPGTGGAEPETRNPQLEEEPTESSDSVDAAVFAGWDSERRDDEEAALAAPRVHLTTRDYLAPECTTCGASSGQDCRAVPDGPRRTAAHYLRSVKPHASRLIAARLLAVSA